MALLFYFKLYLILYAIFSPFIKSKEENENEFVTDEVDDDGDGEDDDDDDSVARLALPTNVPAQVNGNAAVTANAPGANVTAMPAQTTVAAVITTTMPSVNFCPHPVMDGMLVTEDKHIYIFNNDWVVKMNLKTTKFVNIFKTADNWKEVQTPIDEVSHSNGAKRYVVFFKGAQFWVYNEDFDYSDKQDLVTKGTVKNTMNSTVRYQSIEWQPNDLVKVIFCNENNEPIECDTLTSNSNGSLVIEIGKDRCNNHSSSVYDCNVRDYIDTGDIAYLLMANKTDITFIDTRDNDYKYNIKKDIYKCKDEPNADQLKGPDANQMPKVTGNQTADNGNHTNETGTDQSNNGGHTLFVYGLLVLLSWLLIFIV